MSLRHCYEIMDIFTRFDSEDFLIVNLHVSLHKRIFARVFNKREFLCLILRLKILSGWILNLQNINEILRNSRRLTLFIHSFTPSNNIITNATVCLMTPNFSRCYLSCCEFLDLFLHDVTLKLCTFHA